jgi:hypothetical protein
MLERVAAASTDRDVPLVPFWPLRGQTYDRELLVIGRSVNGWVDDRTARQLAEPAVRRSVIEFLREDAEPFGSCRMSWVTDRWGATDGYNTSRSAFWRVVRRFVLANPANVPDMEHWSSRLAWTNLYKVSPAAGWNPGGDLQRAQRVSAIDLLKLEIASFAPHRIVAQTGSWVGPFLEGLGVSLEARRGLVEGVALAHGAAWVVAKHSMGKPSDLFVADVMSAFADLGRPLDRSSVG